MQGHRWNHHRCETVVRQIWVNAHKWSVSCCKINLLLLRHWSKINRTTSGFNGVFADIYRLAGDTERELKRAREVGQEARGHMVEVGDEFCSTCLQGFQNYKVSEAGEVYLSVTPSVNE